MRRHLFHHVRMAGAAAMLGVLLTSAGLTAQAQNATNQVNRTIRNLNLNTNADEDITNEDDGFFTNTGTTNTTNQGAGGIIQDNDTGGTNNGTADEWAAWIALGLSIISLLVAAAANRRWDAVDDRTGRMATRGT